MNIGKIKWFGGYNFKNNSYNKHGFLENIINLTPEYVNINDVNKKSIIWKYYKDNSNQLINGNFFSDSFVFYDVDLSKGKSRAINIIHLSEDKNLLTENELTETFGKLIYDSPNFIFSYTIIQNYIDIFYNNLNWFNSIDIYGKIEICYMSLQKNRFDNSEIFFDTISYYLQPKNRNFTYLLSENVTQKLQIILKSCVSNWENRVMDMFQDIISRNPEFKFSQNVVDATMNLFARDPDLFRFVSTDIKINLCYIFLTNRTWSNQEYYLNLLQQIYSDDLSQYSFSKENEIIELSKEMIVKNINNINVYSFLNIDKKFELLIFALNNNIWEKKGINNFIHALFKEALESNYFLINRNKLTEWYLQIPLGIEKNYEFIKHLGSVAFCNLIWEKESYGIDYWDYLDEETKIKFIFRMSYTFDTIQSLYLNISREKLQRIMCENNKLVLGVAYIFLEKYFKGQDFFIIGHKLIEEYICEIVRRDDNNDEELYGFLYNITKSCDYHITGYKGMTLHLCEGKLWNTKDGIKTYCPRTRKVCNYNLLNSSLQNIGEVANKSWEEWDIHDLLRSGNIIPIVKNLDKPDEYMYKLNGWVNRISEIRARLRCSGCKQIMIPNYEYSKLKSAYNITITKCPNDSPEYDHDVNIYINHCSGCDQVIDSRESTIQQEDTKYYLCIHCGRGMKNHPKFKEGDVCPKCGKKNMTKIQHKLFLCDRCEHIITTPSH